MGFLVFTRPSCPNTPPPRTTGRPDGYPGGDSVIFQGGVTAPLQRGLGSGSEMF